VKVRVFPPVGHDKYHSELGRVKCEDKTCMTMCIVQNNICLWSSDDKESRARVDIREDRVDFESMFLHTKLRLSFLVSSMIIYLIEDKNRFMKAKTKKE